MIAAASGRYLLINWREAPHFSMDLSSVFLTKKWGILIKKESECLIVTGLKIPRDYIIRKEEKAMKKIRYDRTIDILKKNIEEYIDNNYTSESRIVVFGTSIIAGIIVAFFRKHNIEPEFFIDNAKHIQGYDTYGLKVYSPKVLEDNFDENFTVIIASSFQEEMQNQLEAMGYKENKNIIKIID